MKKNKKAQIWSLDLVIASFIFMVGIIILFVYAINYNSETKSSLDELFYEGNLASGLILSESDFGILTNDRVNQSRLTSFDCPSKRNDMNLRYSFYFDLDGSSYCDVPSNPENIIKVTRITINENKPAKFELFVYN